MTDCLALMVLTAPQLPVAPALRKSAVVLGDSDDDGDDDDANKNKKPQSDDVA